MECRVRAHPLRFKTSTCYRSKRSSYVNSHKPKHVRATAASADAFDGGDRDVAPRAALSVGAAAAAARAGAGAPQGAAFTATVFNLVNVIMGAGYVSIPFACRQGGWVALGVLWLLGAVFCYTGNTILQCCERVDQQQRQQQQQLLLSQQQHQQAQPQQQQPTLEGVQQQQQQQHLQSADAKLTANNEAAAKPAAAAAAAAAPAVSPAGYEAVAGAAFGPLGRLLVSGVMYAELLGICCVYIVLEAEALSTLLGHTAVGSWLSSSCGSNGYVLAAAALIVPTVLLPSVEALAALGALGVMAAVTVGCVLSGLYSSTPAALTALADTSFIHLSTLPQVLGVLAFVYAGHSTFPVIQQSMSQPAAGQRAVTLGYIITAAICTLIGGFGYALWGPATEQVVTANLSAGSLLALVLTALTAANPFSAFAVTLEPVALMLQQRLQKWRASRQQPGHGSSSGGSGKEVAGMAANTSSMDDIESSSSTLEVPYTVRATIRLGLALACCITAMLLPYVTDLMAFVGALLTMTISLILPALMHLQLFKQDMPGWLLVFDCAVVLLGVTCAYVGATSAFSSLQQKLLAGAACA